jgi:hypothetical protein
MKKSNKFLFAYTSVIIFPTATPISPGENLLTANKPKNTQIK